MHNRLDLQIPLIVPPQKRPLRQWCLDTGVSVSNIPAPVVFGDVPLSQNVLLEDSEQREKE
jgi:hypothetical protein